MSFSSNVKQELCRTPLNKKCCAVSESYGVLLFCNTFTAKQIKIVTESRELPRRSPRLFKKAFGLNLTDCQSLTAAANSLLLTQEEKIEAVFSAFGLSAGQNLALHLNFSVLEDESCYSSFLRGAFLSGGSVTDPEKRYHLELATSHNKVAKETFALMLDMGFFPQRHQPQWQQHFVF